MVPQLHLPGAEGEVDFGDIYVALRGETVKLRLFSLRLSASGRACHRAFTTQAQEAFLAGHEDAFERMGGVPGRIRYDNLKPAVVKVLLGRDRIESVRFVTFRSHFGFDSFYCRPGIEGAHETGGTEGDIGFFRRNHLVPVPKVDSLAELNELIAAADEEDLGRVIEGKRATIGADFATERLLLSPLPSSHYEVGVPINPKVDAKSRVWVRQCKYSVPVKLIGRRVDARLRADEVIISHSGRVVAHHERLVHRLDESLHLDHYLEILLVQPGYPAEDERKVRGPPQVGPDRVGHVGRVQACGRHLVEERLEGMEVVLVHHLHRSPCPDHGRGRRRRVPQPAGRVPGDQGGGVTMGSLGHDGLLSLARKAYVAAGDADTVRRAEDLGTFVHALGHHLDHETPTLSRLPPAEARLVRRGQARVSVVARALLHDAEGGCTGRGRQCAARAEELLALLTLQASDERLVLHGAASMASTRRGLW